MTSLKKIEIDGRTFDLGDFTEYAKLASPAFTGTPRAPTASKTTNTTQIATTAFVKNVVADCALSSSLGSLASEDSITHSEISDWASATSSFLTEHQDISGLLAKTGGTMSGVITRNGVLAQSGSTSGSITIQNGTAASGGGGIWIYGASHTNKGKVRLQAYDSTHKKYCALDANGDGTLTWCGDSVATTNYVDAAIAAITDADSTGY